MSDFNGIVKAIKKASIEAVATSKPTAICFGVVTKVEPLEISVDQKMTLTKAQLILTQNVTDFKMKMTMNHVTENHTHTHSIVDTYTGGGSASNETHNHKIVGEKEFTLHKGLCKDDEVILIQMQGGQKYIVLDKVVSL